MITKIIKCQQKVRKNKYSETITGSIKIESVLLEPYTKYEVRLKKIK